MISHRGQKAGTRGRSQEPEGAGWGHRPGLRPSRPAPGARAGQGHKPKPQSLCLRHTNSDNELVGKVSPTQEDILAVFSGPQVTGCSSPGREAACPQKHQSAVDRGRWVGGRDLALTPSHSRPSKSRAEENEGHG